MASRKIEDFMKDKNPICEYKDCEQIGKHHRCYDGEYLCCKRFPGFWRAYSEERLKEKISA